MGVHVIRAEPTGSGRTTSDGAGSRRDDDHWCTDGNRGEDLNRHASVGKTAENFEFVLGPEWCGRKENREKKYEQERDFSHEPSLRTKLGTLTEEWMRRIMRLLPLSHVSFSM